MLPEKGLKANLSHLRSKCRKFGWASELNATNKWMNGYRSSVGFGTELREIS
jgi:hypothetical protein